MSKLINFNLSNKILGFAFTIHNALGAGLLESVYEKAFCIELMYNHIPFECQKRYSLKYRNEDVGEYISDIVVDKSIIIEVKSVKRLTDNMAAQIINYLRLSKIQVGYLINFRNKSVEWARYVNYQRE